MQNNSPIDINKEQIQKYQDRVEKFVSGLKYNNSPVSLPNLIQRLDDQHDMMSSVEGKTYAAIKEGFQIFNALTDIIGEKVGLHAAIRNETPELPKLREFVFNYATFGTSSYIVKKMEDIIIEEGEKMDLEKKLDITMGDYSLDVPDQKLQLNLLSPVLKPLIAHAMRKKGETAIYTKDTEFNMVVREVFNNWKKQSLNRQNIHSDLSHHLTGYDFRIMDEYIVLCGYEDKSRKVAVTMSDKPAFVPANVEDMTGNDDIKFKMDRLGDFIMVYDPIQQFNPIVEFGGLPWTIGLFGKPGTGKTLGQRILATKMYKRGQMIGRKVEIISIDPKIKDEYYGKTAKLLYGLYNRANDPNGVYMIFIDDIGLLLKSRGDGQGADLDILNISMQHLDGFTTIKRGNLLNICADNEFQTLDPAIRNRINFKVEVEGPKTPYDAADMLVIKAKSLIENGLLIDGNSKPINLGYTPLETQTLKAVKARKKGDLFAYKQELFLGKKNATLIEWGEFMEQKMKENPLISGRSITAIIESMKDRTADFDIPEEFFEKPEVYFDQPYERKKAMIKELYRPQPMDVLFQETERYCDSEDEIRRVELEGAVHKNYDSMMFNLKARHQVLKEAVLMGEKSKLVEVEVLENYLQQLTKQHNAAVLQAMRNAEEEKRGPKL